MWHIANRKPPPPEDPLPKPDPEPEPGSDPDLIPPPPDAEPIPAMLRDCFGRSPFSAVPGTRVLPPRPGYFWTPGY